MFSKIFLLYVIPFISSICFTKKFYYDNFDGRKILLFYFFNIAIDIN